MPVYNEEDNVRRAVSNIVNQSYKNIEVVVVEDGSNDETKNILYRLKKRHKNIKICVNDVNRGLAYSLNKGVERCEGVYIARQDADDFSHPRRIEYQVKTLLCRRGVDVISCNARFIKSGCSCSSWNLKKKKDKILKVNSPSGIVHGSLVIKRDVLISYKYNEKYKYSQDREMLNRMLSDGVEIFRLNRELYALSVNVYDEKTYDQYIYYLKAEGKEKLCTIHKNNAVRSFLEPLYKLSDIMAKQSYLKSNNFKKYLLKILSATVYPLKYVERYLQR